ncbi:hypothetical protein JCM8115_006962 [Rhodotorula mucilaginosa]|uniref:Protein transport protein SFT2 n=1 Tax=Rhodotorula mucilaginosa TaxID=5537 RepID=A0A9P7B309_RHOMI|nr:hypothetical protein C6P46_000718 [Rhodotorula mucilaginosa]KAG0656172.1 hypothetical protein C6P46_000411 [Rhodotorula mucilaginosa]
MEGLWNKLSGSESAAIVDNMTTGDDSAFKFLDLTRTQRLYGFGICLVCGFALSLIGAICFVLGQITLFATLYTLGVVCSLVGTGFLLGFWKQCKMMMDPVRIYAAGIFLLCIALTFVFAFAIEIDVLVIIFAVATYLSYAWYSLSYIPYARALARKLWPW